MNVLYARNEFKGVLIRCPHCTFSSRHDPDDIGDAIKEGKSVMCGACDKQFYVFVSAASREAVEQCLQPTLLEDQQIFNLQGKKVASGKFVFDKPQSG